jgi:hypothetical protein
VPVNAAQFAAAANGAVATPGSVSLADFLLASSTNSLNAPDFKTIAASFFADTKATASLAVQKPVATDTKSVGTSSPRTREAGKDDRAQNSESISPFLPIIPTHLLNVVPSQYHISSHPQFAPSPQANGPDDNSAAPSGIPVGTTSQRATSAMSKGSQSFLDVPQAPSLSMGQNPKWNDADGKSTTEFSTQPEANLKAMTFPSQTSAADEQSLEAKQPVEDAAVSVTSTSSGPNNNLTSTSVFAFAPEQGLAGVNLQSAATAVKPSLQKTVQTSAPLELKNQSAANMLKSNRAQAQHASLHTDSSTAAHSATSKLHSEIQAPKQARPITGTTPVSQPENMIADSGEQSVVSEPQAFSGQIIPHAPAADSLSTSIPQSGAAENQATASSTPAPVQTVTPVIDAVANEESNVKPATTDLAPTVKPVVSKSKFEHAAKSKTQATNVDSQAQTSNVTESHRREIHPANNVQNTATTANKDHEAVTPQVSFASHIKSDSQKNEPGISDPAGPNLSQNIDADDVAPASHTGVNTAKLVQSLTQSELRVGLQTRDFGNIDIRTSASRHEFTAQISVEHGEVAHTLTSELPNLYARLNEQQVPVSNIHILDQSLATSSGLDQRSQQSSQQAQSSGFTKQQAEPTLPAIHEVLGTPNRLDIRV